MANGDDQHIRALFAAAWQAMEGGRPQDAQRLLQQAEAAAPQHPLVQNEIALRRLQAGDPAGAYDLLLQALRQDPTQASIWLNFAFALRGLQRPDDERLALHEVLAIEPNNVRALLQLATLEELQGKPREAAKSFRMALQQLPPGFVPPPPMRPILQHAMEVIDANHRELERFIEDRLADLRVRHAEVSQKRFDDCLAVLLQKRRVYRPQPTFMHFPHLPAIEWYERADFPWLDAIEAATDDIRAELLAVLADGQDKLDPYVSFAQAPPDKWRELNNSRRWGVYYFYREGVAYPEHLARCPKTAAALASWPGYDVPGNGPSALYSILDAKTRIPPHTGVSNTRLIVHLPLVIPKGCGFRVGAQTREWHPGKAMIFDDTIEHEVWNDNTVPRAVMIFDIWNPYLTEAERDLVRSTTVAVGEYYGTGAYRES